MEVELDSGATAGAGAARYLGASRIVIARLRHSEPELWVRCILARQVYVVEVELERPLAQAPRAMWALRASSACVATCAMDGSTASGPPHTS